MGDQYVSIIIMKWWTEYSLFYSSLNWLLLLTPPQKVLSIFLYLELPPVKHLNLSLPLSVYLRAVEEGLLQPAEFLNLHRWVKTLIAFYA